MNESLKRLRSTTIDLLYLHRWDATLDTPGTLQVLNDLIIKGKVSMPGASNFTTEQLLNTLHQQSKNKFTAFQFVQNNNNLAISDVGIEFKKLCPLYNIKIVTYSPLCAGFLTGKHQNGVRAGTRFALIPGHGNAYFSNETFSKLKRLQKVAEQTGYTSSHLALAWALHQLGIAFVLAGGRTTTHIDQVISATVSMIL